MDWRKHIHSDPEILLGKPVVRGTRISVEFILEALSAGETVQDLLEDYPQLTESEIRAALAFAAATLR